MRIIGNDLVLCDEFNLIWHCLSFSFAYICPSCGCGLNVVVTHIAYILDPDLMARIAAVLEACIA